MKRNSAHRIPHRSVSTATDVGTYELNCIAGEIDRVLSSTRSTSVGVQQPRCLDVNLRVAVNDKRGESKEIEVNVSTTAADLCRTFDQRVDLRYVQLYEELPELPGFGHPIEDHELIISVTRKWWSSNWPFEEYEPRFFLVANPNKYSLHMVDDALAHCSTSFLSSDDHPRNSHDKVSLLSYASKAKSASERQCSIPPYVTSGILWFRSPHRTWRKMFCFLHGSCVFYSVRHHRVAASCMRILVDLSTVDLFQPLANFNKAIFGAPTPEIIVCRPHYSQPLDLKNMVIFACRTPEGRAAWENGFRIHKFGLSRLEANMRRATYPDHLNHSTEGTVKRKKITYLTAEEIRTTL